MSTSKHLSRRVALWERARSGDDQARSDLIEDFLPLARYYAKKRAYPAGIHEDELMGDAVEGIIKAIKRYDPEQHKTNLEVYVGGYIRYYISESDFLKSVFHESKWQRKHDAVPPILSLDTPIGDSEYCLIDIIAFSDTPSNHDISESVCKALLTLTKTEHIVIDKYFGITGECLSLRGIAAHMKLAHSTIHKYYHKALSKLKVALQEPS